MDCRNIFRYMYTCMQNKKEWNNMSPMEVFSHSWKITVFPQLAPSSCPACPFVVFFKTPIRDKSRIVPWPSPPTSPLPKKQILFPISLCQRFLDLWDFLYHNLPITFMCNPHPQKLSFCKIALGHIPRWALLPLRRQDDVVVSLTIPPSNHSHAYLILVLIT